jgi:hypothetical protein
MTPELKPMPELLPCPFCPDGGRPEVNDQGTDCAVVCDACLTCGPFFENSFHFNTPQHDARKKEMVIDAIKAWNTRPPQDAGLPDEDSEIKWQAAAFILAERFLDQGSYDWNPNMWLGMMTEGLRTRTGVEQTEGGDAPGKNCATEPTGVNAENVNDGSGGLISVKDRLPPYDEELRVIAHTADHDFGGEQYFDVKALDLYPAPHPENQHYGEYKTEVAEATTHWMYRPGEHPQATLRSQEITGWVDEYDIPPLCHNVDFGTYKNAVLVQAPNGKLITIDICMIPEIKWLWDHGIETIESCCGHAKLPGYVAVSEESREKMTALGYVSHRDSPHCYEKKSKATPQPAASEREE